MKKYIGYLINIVLMFSGVSYAANEDDTVSTISTSTISYYTAPQEPIKIAALQGKYRIISKDGYVLSIGSEYAEALSEDSVEEGRGGFCTLVAAGGERVYLITNADRSKVLNVLHAFGTNFLRFFWWLGARPVDGEVTVESNDGTWKNHKRFLAMKEGQYVQFFNEESRSVLGVDTEEKEQKRKIKTFINNEKNDNTLFRLVKAPEELENQDDELPEKKKQGLDGLVDNINTLLVTANDKTERGLLGWLWG